MNDALKGFMRDDVLKRFLRYAAIDTMSSETSGEHPSTVSQFDLANLLSEEMKALGLEDAEVDQFGYVYGTLPATEGVTASPVTFCAHLDTSPSESGKDVKPRLIEDYQGEDITFPDDENLTLTCADSPELMLYRGDTIITASGATLLGADDKAGIAEIMTALAVLHADEKIRHPELRIVFTPDEEIGSGTDNIDLKRLGKVGYTLDGSLEGHVEDECFDAYGVDIHFTGRNVHPGFAKDKMINAAQTACRFMAALPEWEQPEHTAAREGFYHLTGMSGDENEASLTFILRDFERAKNLERIELLKSLKDSFEKKYPGLGITLAVKDQYSNMKEILSRYPEVTGFAEQAIEAAGMTAVKTAIRGGTDGARLTFRGVPTPNIFAGGLMFHSKKEWVPLSAMVRAADTVLHLCMLWAEIKR